MLLDKRVVKNYFKSEAWNKALEHAINIVKNGYYCRICKKFFGTGNQAMSHYEDIHVEAGFEFICPYCPEHKYKRSSLYTHMRVKHKLNVKRNVSMWFEINVMVRLFLHTLRLIDTKSI